MPSDQTHTDRSSQLAALAIVVLLLALLMLGIGQCGSETPDELKVSAEIAPTVEPTEEQVTETEPLALPTAVPSPTPVPIAAPTPAFGPTGRPSDIEAVNVLTAGASISRPLVYDAPDGKQVEVNYQFLNGNVIRYAFFTNPTYYGNPLALMVVEGEPGDEWAKVQIPTRPITEGWIRTEGFEWSSSNYYIRINVSNNTVTVWNGDELVADSVSVVTGDTGRETPIASTFVDEIMPGHSSAYGPWMLSLGVFSDSINTFSGGLPKTAMHGTNRPDLLGQYASNGCIRLPNDVISALAAEVPVGTRVDIVRDA